jgi:hypothetical protein
LHFNHQLIQHLLSHQIQTLVPIFTRLESTFNPTENQILIVIVQFALRIDDAVLIGQNHPVKTQRMHALIGL